MAEEKKEEIAVIEITEEYMKERIYEIRGQRVILDSDLSEIYLSFRTFTHTFLLSQALL